MPADKPHTTRRVGVTRRITKPAPSKEYSEITTRTEQAAKNSAEKRVREESESSQSEREMEPVGKCMLLIYFDVIVICRN